MEESSTSHLSEEKKEFYVKFTFDNKEYEPCSNPKLLNYRYFQEIMNSDTKKIHLGDSNILALRILLSYMKKGKKPDESQLREANALAVYKLAEKFGVELLKDISKEYLEKSIESDDQVCIYLNNAANPEIEKICITYIKKHFEEVVHSEHFLYLSKENMLKILNKDTPISMMTFNRILEWGDKHEIATDDIGEMLQPILNFSLLSAHDLVEIEEKKILGGDALIKPIYDKVREESKKGKRKVSMNAFKTHLKNQDFSFIPQFLARKIWQLISIFAIIVLIAFCTFLTLWFNNGSLSNQIANLEEEKVSLSNQIANLEVEKVSLSDQIANLEEEKASFCDQIANLKEEIKSIKTISSKISFDENNLPDGYIAWNEPNSIIKIKHGKGSAFGISVIFFLFLILFSAIVYWRTI